MNTTLEKYCVDNGISLELTVPHTPEPNGVAERTNWKILDKGRVIMKDTDAPDFLWADAFATIVYAMNCTVSARAGNKTPFKAFSSLSYMRACLSPLCCTLTIMLWTYL